MDYRYVLLVVLLTNTIAYGAGVPKRAKHADHAPFPSNEAKQATGQNVPPLQRGASFGAAHSQAPGTERSNHVQGVPHSGPAHANGHQEPGHTMLGAAKDPHKKITGSAVEGQKQELPWKVCFYTNWSQYRNTPAKFWPEDIDTNLCTHIYYAFSNMGDNVLLPYEANDYDLYDRVNALKITNPTLKTVLAVGGWNFGVTNMTLMLSSKANRTQFIDSVISTVTQHDFNGIDLDFEWPGDRGSPAVDMFRFTCLCKEIREAFDLYNAANPQNTLTFTAGVTGLITTAENAYEVKSISFYLDKVILMAYDFFAHYDGKAFPHSPLYAHPDMDVNQALRNVERAATYWVDNGCPKNKLIIGLASYGRGCALDSPLDNGMGAAVTGPSDEFPYTQEAGLASYYELCSLFLPTATVVNEPYTRVPYAYSGNQWFGYEDTLSLRIKGEWIVANSYGGFMFWTLDHDDFSAQCTALDYPLLRAAGAELDGYIVPIDETESPAPDPNFCATKPDGYHQDPDDCTRFYECIGGQTVVSNCPEGTIYDPLLIGCRSPADIEDPTWFCDNCHPQYCNRPVCDV